MIFCATYKLSHKIWCDRFGATETCRTKFCVMGTCRTKFGATGTCRTKISNFHELISTHCNILPPTQSDNTPPPPPPPPSQQHTTTTQHKNNIKHVFEIANLGFLNFNCWSWRSWLLLDVISVELVLLNGIPVRLLPMMVSYLTLYSAGIWWEVWVSYRYWWVLGEIDRDNLLQNFVVWLVLIEKNLCG